MTNTIISILSRWGISGHDISVVAVGPGHIHESFQVINGGKAYFLQKVNRKVFHNPEILASNLNVISRVNFQGQVASLPPYIPTNENQPYCRDPEGKLWRLFPWIESGFTSIEETEKNILNTAKAIGTWTSTVNRSLRLESIQPAIPGFHQFPQVYSKFQTAWNNSKGDRKLKASETIARLAEGDFVLGLFDQLTHAVPVRVIHGDAKSDNVLIDFFGKSWIIDLDTVMPGFLWMDVGDMVRSMACSQPESSPDLEKIRIRPSVVETILEGYGKGIGDLASPLEIESLRLGPCCIIYEQAIRFLTDFFEGDKYYPVSYPEENLVRAQNQLLLWESYVGIYSQELHSSLWK